MHVDDLIELFERDMRAFLATLRDEDLIREIRFTLGGSVEQVMLLGGLLRHAAVHGVHHRGQVSLLLRMLGHAPGNLDMLMYYGERT